MAFLLLWHESRFVVIHEWTPAHVFLFCRVADAVAVTCHILNDGVYLRRVLFGYVQSEDALELLDNGIHAIDGIADGHVCTFLILAHLLSPQVSDLIGHEYA